jgi:hypothetical protein
MQISINRKKQHDIDTESTSLYYISLHLQLITIQ